MYEGAVSLSGLLQERAEKNRREAEAQRAYDEELQRMLDKAAALPEPRIRRL